MAEALGIISGAAQIADVLVRLGRYLHDVYKDAAIIEDHIRDLTNEIVALQDVITSVQDTFEAEIKSVPSGKTGVKHNSTEALWRRVSTSLKSCLKGVTTLETVVKDIIGKNGQTSPGVLDSFAKAHRKRSKTDSLRQCRDQLATYQRNLHLLLTTIDLKNGRSLTKANSDSFQKLSEDLHDINRGVQSSIEVLRENGPMPGTYEENLDSATLSAYNDLKLSVDLAAVAITSVSSNEYFDIPVPVSSIFTGRKRLLEEMRDFFIAPPGVSRDSQQRRFVVCGIGGSGKTQFCCKFAEENRDSFWGVFWIDASTTERIKQTLANIATIAKVEPNVDAALFWLGNIKQRWLLLIDNADDPSISLEKYFPTGNRGHILITTRRQSLTLHGNVGPKFYNFEQLDANDANQLLLRAASKPSFSNVNVVSKITKTLNFLALAIIQAGAAITRKLCTLEDYLGFYENSWSRISRRNPRKGRDEYESPIMKVYASWEVNYTYLEDHPNRTRVDAIELLKIFAFLHRENIRFDILMRALINGAREKEAEQRSEIESESSNKFEKRRIGWFQTVKMLYYSAFSANSPTPFPKLIREGRSEEDKTEYVFALRHALGELVESSLISYDDAKDTYYMHPLQHRYARERLSVAEQGLWAEAAATVLSASILLPPLGSGTEDQDFNKDLIPHLDHVLRCRNNVESDTNKKRSQLWRRWMFSVPLFTRDKAVMYAKFSIAFMQHGRFKEAEELQLPVRDFLHAMLGPEHPKSRAISSVLADTLRLLGRSEESASMQKAVLATCEECFGHQHLETLKAKEKLADTLFQQGQYTTAKAIQKEVVDGFIEKLGHSHEDTLKAKDLFARVIGKFWKPQDFDYAASLHREAISGLEEIHGPDNFDMLKAKESLARLLVEMGDEHEHFDEAEALITEVLEKRKRTLGKEHPYTLLAMIHASIVKCAHGALDDAEDLLRTGLDIANRNLGKDHIGTLAGRSHLGHVLIQQERYPEAEEVLRDTAERQRHMKAHRGDYHPDRVAALIELAKCYRLQGKIELSIQTCDEAIEGFEIWGTEDHPLAVDLREARKRLVDHQESILRGETGFKDVTEPVRGRYQPWHVF